MSHSISEDNVNPFARSLCTSTILLHVLHYDVHASTWINPAGYSATPRRDGPQASTPAHRGVLAHPLYQSRLTNEMKRAVTAPRVLSRIQDRAPKELQFDVIGTKPARLNFEVNEQLFPNLYRTRGVLSPSRKVYSRVYCNTMQTVPGAGTVMQINGH